jgi:tetratricopeptide (TPR) repeat protein
MTVPPRDALADFNRAIDLDPDDARAISKRGETYREMGRYEEALNDFNRAIDLDPALEWLEWAIANRGETYRRMGRYGEALEDLNRAFDLNPDSTWSIRSRGVTYREMGRYGEALADFNRVIELDPDDAWAISSRGQTYHAMGRYQDALGDFNRAIDLDPALEWLEWAIANRGETYRLMERYEEALADFNRAVELDPSDAWAIAVRGETYRLMERYEEALADFNRAVELDPSDDWAIAVRGETYRLMAGYGKAFRDEWRVCIAFGDRRQLTSREQPLTGELSRRLGYQVRVSRSVNQIFWYAPSAGSADETAQVAREVLARRAIRGALVRTERWSPRDQEWRDVTDEPSAVIDAELQAAHEYRQEQERERSRRAGFPAWQVRVEVPSHSDVVALAGHLAAQGWRIRRRRRHLLVGADCEDDAKSLISELSGDGRADAETAFRVGRIRYSYMLYDAVNNSGSG